MFTAYLPDGETFDIRKTSCYVPCGEADVWGVQKGKWYHLNTSKTVFANSTKGFSVACGGQVDADRFRKTTEPLTEEADICFTFGVNSET